MKKSNLKWILYLGAIVLTVVSFFIYWILNTKVESENILEEEEIIQEIIEDQEHFSFEETEIECLALNIYHESRADNKAGKLAVADVVLNRVDDPRYPSTVCDVVYDAKMSTWWLKRGKEIPQRNMCQFSWFCDGKADQPRDGRSWEDAKMLAHSLYNNGEFRGITEGATHYHATYVNPKWIHDRGMNVVGRIGEHIFYRWDR